MFSPGKNQNNTQRQLFYATCARLTVLSTPWDFSQGSSSQLRLKSAWLFITQEVKQDTPPSCPAACKFTVHFTRPLPNMAQPILVAHRTYGCLLTQPSTWSPLPESRRGNSLYSGAICFSHLAEKLFQHCQKPNTQVRLLEFYIMTLPFLFSF